MVYPGEVEVSVELDPACLNEDSTSCTATIGINAVYQVTITQTNRVGATTNNCLSFDRMFMNMQCDVLFLLWESKVKATCYEHVF